MNFDASNPDAESVQCAVCEKLITGGKWFSRIVCGEITVALCCPLCTETFQQNPAPYIRRIQTLALLNDKSGPFLHAAE
jgi:hypothetical protein